MEALHQTQLNSFLLSKIKSVLIFFALFLSSNFIVSGIFAKEEIRYVKGLGAVLREQPSILSKKLTFRKLFQSYNAAAEGLFREDR